VRKTAEMSRDIAHKYKEGEKTRGKTELERRGEEIDLGEVLRCSPGKTDQFIHLLQRV